MFWYTCRYCKVSFGKWGKLVSHKRDEHREEFEVLRRALLLSEQGSAIAKFLQLEGGNVNATTMHSHPPSALSSPPLVKKEEEIDKLKLPARQITTSAPPKLSLELDAKDLENQGVSLRIPASTLYNNNSRPSLYPSISSSSFYHNGNGVVDYKRSHFYSGSEITTSNRIPSSSSTSQALTDKNWTAPFPFPSTSAVLYHQMNDDDEMEICVSPSAGYRISITTHPVSRKILVGASSSSSSKSHHTNTNETNYFQKKEALQRNHVVIDELRDELQMSCVTKKHSHFNGEIKQTAPASAHTAFAMLKNRGKRLKRLHSQLQLQPPFSMSNGGDCRDNDDNDNITQRRMKKLINGSGISRRRDSIDSATSPVEAKVIQELLLQGPTKL